MDLGIYCLSDSHFAHVHPIVVEYVQWDRHRLALLLRAVVCQEGAGSALDVPGGDRGEPDQPCRS